MQTRSPIKLALLALAAGALVLTAGCAGKGGKTKDTAYVARDVDTLYQAAKDRLDRGDTAKPQPCSTRWSASIPIRRGPAAPS